MCETNLIVLLNKIIYVSICILFSFRIESDVVKCTLRFVWYQYLHACVCRIIWLSRVGRVWVLVSQERSKYMGACILSCVFVRVLRINLVTNLKR